ncbi:MAG: DUF3696 domain-containing protein [Planctomycetes bacterium]|nr:DUF3696 domain-containing protein [Planctomycetota bacterium]
MAARASSQRQPEREQIAITAVAVSGFKSICDECALEIRPLTILAGANSSGKSSAIQPLLLVKQTLEQSYDPGPLLLDGDNVRFTSADQLLCRVAGRPRVDQFRVTVEVGAYGRLSVAFGRDDRGTQHGLAVQEMRSTYSGRMVVLRPGMSHEEIDAALPGQLHLMEAALPPGTTGKYRWVVKPNRCFLEPGLDIPAGAPGSHLLFFWGRALTWEWPFDEALKSIIHVPGLRVLPARVYRVSGTGPLFPGTFENYIASLIYEWQTQADDRLQQLGSALSRLGLAWKVVARRLDDTRIELLVPRLPQRRRVHEDLVNVADVGLGVPQVLPALVALIQAAPGETVYLEEPEIHLHPKAQTELARVLADAAKRGVRVIAETHSSLLLLGVQTLVAEGELSPDLVKLHWFTKDKQGATKITSRDLDKAGAFGDWPVDFGDVELGAQNRYLNAGR